MLAPVLVEASQLSWHLPECLSPLSLCFSMDQIPKPLHLQTSTRVITRWYHEQTPVTLGTIKVHLTKSNPTHAATFKIKQIKTLHFYVWYFFSCSSWLPLLNPSFPLGRLSAWTPQLQQASCQAHFLKKHTNTRTKRAYKHKDTYEEQGGGALWPQHTYKQRKIKCKVIVSPWVHLEWKHTWRQVKEVIFSLFLEKCLKTHQGETMVGRNICKMTSIITPVKKSGVWTCFSLQQTQVRAH